MHYIGVISSIFFCEFVPQILFLFSIFGYMVILIIYKWLVSWNNLTPPLLLNVVINMFLTPGSVTESLFLFNHQAPLQVLLVLVALIAVPWMLFTKPYILKRRHASRYQILPQHMELESEEVQPSKEHAKSEVEPSEQPEQGGGHGGHGHGGATFDFTEIFVHQIIHTIEFVLGSISNTASYLRLWALSLAHSELSQVFWSRLLIGGVSFGGYGIGAFVGFAAWAAATFGVLLLMESLSAFLHALRLHWVEFQNKFYHGDGHKFAPFSYERLLSNDDD